MPVPKVRRATRDDAPAIGLVHVLSWQSAYRGQMPDDFLDNLDVENRTQTWIQATQRPERDVFVAEDEEGHIAGFCDLAASGDSDADSSTGEITAIYVHPGKWKKGFGAVLLSSAIDRARERNYGQVTLWVLETNRRARAFYESFGFDADGGQKTEHHSGGFSLHEVRYRLELTPT